MERTLKIDIATKTIVEATSIEVMPQRTHDFEFTIPGCTPPLAVGILNG
jgi:hypothetical protein